MRTDRLTVVVPTRDRPAQLQVCLEALLRVRRDGDEIVVVDSASVDAEVSAVAKHAGVRLVRCDEPGASRARNAGAAAASHRRLAFVDDDVRVRPGWAEAMAAALDGAGVAFVCGRVMAPPDQDDYPRPVALAGGDEPLLLDRRCVTELGNSANLGVDRDAFHAVGGFDEALGGGARFGSAEDHDLFDRLLLGGFVGRYEPAALGWHDQWRSRRQLLELDWRYGVGTGARLAKLVRLDRQRARQVLHDVTWETDAKHLASVVRRRHEFAALTIGLRLAGTAVGFAGAVVWRVVDGHLRRRR